MRRLFTLLSIVTTVLVGCEQSGVNEPDNPIDDPLVTFAEGTEVNPTIGYVGGELTFSFISNCSWTVEENDDWINISPTSGNQGNHTLAINVAKNTTGEERLSKITILYGVDSQVVINLTQEANDVFETDSEGNYIVEADGGTVAVKVTTNLEYDVLIPDEASAWLSLADTRAVREETLTFNVAKNEDNQERSTVVNLCANGGKILQAITIKQDKSTTITCANNEIIYTTKYGYPIELNITDGFGGNLMSHTYENGYGRIIFDDDVICIPEKAFKECTTLTEVILPNNLSIIGKSALYGCTSLSSITIGSGVTTIESWAFSGCNNLTEFKGKFAEDDGRVLVIDGTLKAFAPAELREYSIPNSVMTIGEYVFYNCDSITNITIPDSVTTIVHHAFSECSGLESVTIGKGVTTIGDSAFFYCDSLSCITISDSVTTIGNFAFENCSNLTNVTIPNSVTTIGWGALSGCRSLTNVYCKAFTPPVGSSHMFFNNASDRKIYVPKNSVEAYKTTEFWSDYADYIVGYNF